jgi:hypothetical protein
MMRKTPTSESIKMGIDKRRLNKSGRRDATAALHPVKWWNISKYCQRPEKKIAQLGDSPSSPDWESYITMLFTIQ